MPSGRNIKGITVEIGGDTTGLQKALKEVNSEIKNTQSQLKDVERLLKLDPGNTELLRQKQKLLGQELGSTSDKLKTLKTAAEQAVPNLSKYDAWKEKYDPIQKEHAKTEASAKELKSQLDELGKTGGINTDEYKNLQTQLDETKNKAKELKTQMEAVRDEFGHPISPEQYDALQREIAETDLKLKDLKKQGATTSEFFQGVIVKGEAIKGVSKQIGDVGRELAPMATKAAIVGAAGVKAAMDWETAFTGVKKTVKATDEEYEALGKGIRQMATETASSMEEIAGVAEVAGQLGIGKENLLDFTKTMVMLGDTTNLSAEEAATSLARFINITGDSQSDVDKLGSAIVDLGNNFATSESEIVTMATRLASAGTIAGLSSTDILALSTAMSSVGIQAEAGGTAMTQTLTALEETIVHWRNATEDELESATENLKTFADVAGMELEDFANTWETKPIEAVQSFIAGLGELDESGDSMILKLEELGLTGIRQQNMLEALGLASDVLADSINTSSEAYENNTALAEEAALRYETFESKLSQFKESLKNVAIDMGEILIPAVEKLMDVIKKMVGWFEKLPDGLQKLIVFAVGFTAILSPILIGVSKIGTAIGNIVSWGGKLGGFIANLGGASSAAGGLAGAASGLAGSAGAAATGVEAIGSAAGAVAATGTAAAGSFLATTGAVAGLAAAVVAGGMAIEDTKKHYNELNAQLRVQYQSAKDAAAAVAELQTKYAAVSAEVENYTLYGLDGVNQKQDEQAYILAMLQSAQEQYAALIAAEGSATEDLTGKLQTNTTALDENAAALTEATTGAETATTESSATATAALNTLSETTASTSETINATLAADSEAVITTADNVFLAISEKSGAIVAAVQSTAEQITGTITSVNGQAYGWGADLVGNYASGINSRMGALLSSVRSMAAQIRSYLHFSEPDVGPLSDFHTWMPDFMSGLAEGIDRNSYLVENAIKRVAQGMAISPQLATAGALGRAGSSNSTMRHSGTIRVEGVNSAGDVAGVVDIIIDQLRREVRL